MPVTGPVETAAFNYVKDLATEGTKIGASYLRTRVNYFLHYKKKVKDLNTAISPLVHQKEYINKCIENACGEDRVVTEGTESWLEKVTKLEETVNKMVAESEKGLNMSDVVKRFKLGKDAEKLMTDVDQLRNERSTLTTFYPSAVPRYNSRPQKDFKDYSAMVVSLDQVIDALKDDNNRRIAIYGMGGIGKSTLMDQIGRRMEEENIFDVVLGIDLSQNPSISMLQDHIAEQLGKTFRANSVEQRACELASSIRRENRVLIMLDNLWSEVDLAATGIPIGDDNNECRVLISSRKIEVCNQMNTDAQFSINFLSEEDSWDLFKSKAGDVVGLSELESIAKEVANECGRLPLALVVVGTALRGANDTDVWNHALKQLRQSNPRDLESVERKLFKCLELSYNNLQRDNYKLLFLLCSLFPEGYELTEDELTRYGIGEDNLGSFDNLEVARENVCILVTKLRNSCLLLNAKKAKTVRMHDVVRDVAVYIGKDNGFFINCGLGTKEGVRESDFNQTRRISLMNNRDCNLPNQPLSPQLQMLMVRNNQSLTKLHDNFFKCMGALTVLDLSDTAILLLPSSVRYLRNLRVFCLNRCKKIRDISIIGKLENLLVLSFQDCPVKSLPKEIGRLAKLRLLDLSCSPNLNVPSRLIGNLQFLEELYLDISSLSEAVIIEITSLKRLKCLQLYIKDPTIFSHDLIPVNSWGNLKSYVLFTERSLIKYAKLWKKNLYLKGLERVTAWVKLLLGETEDVIFHTCFRNEAVLLEFAQLDDLTRFEKLKVLRIINCHSVGYLLRSQGSVPKHSFVNLEELHLTNLDNLNGISEGAVSELSFKNTQKIYITSCKNTFILIPYGLLIRMHQNLEDLRVKNCEQLRAVFDFPTQVVTDLIFSKLKTLQLDCLSQLTDIWRGIVPQGNFANLKDLHVQGCNNLRYLFTASLITGLQCLERMLLANNHEMEEIVFDDGFLLDQNVFPRLTDLSITNLTKLKHFYKVEGSVKTFSWPLLKKLRVGSCLDLKMLPIGSQSASLLRKIELVKESDLTWFQGLLWEEQTIPSRFESFVSPPEHGYE